MTNKAVNLFVELMRKKRTDNGGNVKYGLNTCGSLEEKKRKKFRG